MNATPKRAGFLATIRAVLWSFLGVRKRKGYLEDAGSLDPLAVIVAGVMAGGVFVLVLVLLVQLIVG